MAQILIPVLPWKMVRASRNTVQYPVTVITPLSGMSEEGQNMLCGSQEYEALRTIACKSRAPNALFTLAFLLFVRS